MLFGDYFKKMRVVQQLPMLYAVPFLRLVFGSQNIGGI